MACPSDFPAWLSGVTFGAVMMLVGGIIFLVLGGGIWVETVWGSTWSQQGDE